MLETPENADAADATVVELVSMLPSLMVLSRNRNDRSLRGMPLWFSQIAKYPCAGGAASPDRVMLAVVESTAGEWARCAGQASGLRLLQFLFQLLEISL
jgi:hypothetical protein